METNNLANENYKKLMEIFPDAITETIDDEGNIVHAIDKDVLMQEINSNIIDDNKERYQLTWPDKKKSIILSNTPTTNTLRLNKEKSSSKDGLSKEINSSNIFIEGDNLEGLKIIRETYLGKIRMIYIDPPYNTGTDYIYKDKFYSTMEEYTKKSGEIDEYGNRLKTNTENNGRFHTDWLNMIYPRIRIAKDLLSNDGVIFVSIDYNENFNMRHILDEVFGQTHFIGEICWESKTKSQNTITSFNKLQPKCESILVYSKDPKRKFNLIPLEEKKYPMTDEHGVYREYTVELMNANGIRGRESMIFGISDGKTTIFPPEGKQWKIGKAKIEEYKDQGNLFIRNGKVIIKMRPEFENNVKFEPFWGFFSKDIGTAESAKKELSSLIKNHGFETVKPIELIQKLIFHATDKNDIILDFFSGSGTTASAIIKANSIDNGNRKFILMQLPVKFDKSSDTYKEGFTTICDMAEERIKREAMLIKRKTCADIDYGFRCFKVDTSNMKNVYYSSKEYNQSDLQLFEDIIKPNRASIDLLIQVMLDLGIDLSSRIDELIINNNKVFIVEDGYLYACFDKSISEKTVKEIALNHPFFAVFRDLGMENDSVLTNFDQIFKTYSPNTKRRII